MGAMPERRDRIADNRAKGRGLDRQPDVRRMLGGGTQGRNQTTRSKTNHKPWDKQNAGVTWKNE